MIYPPTFGEQGSTYTVPTTVSLHSNEAHTKAFITIADIPTYTLPTASDTVLGGIKVGNTLSIVNGVLNTTASGSIADPGSSIDREILTWDGITGDAVRTSVGVKIDATSTVLADGDLIAYQSGSPVGNFWDNLPAATNSTLGGFILWDTQFTMTNGILKIKDNVLSPAVHTHDDRYYTESEIDTRISGIEAIMSTDTERINAVNALTSSYTAADTSLNDTLTSALTLKAPLANPTFTGSVTNSGFTYYIGSGGSAGTLSCDGNLDTVLAAASGKSVHLHGGTGSDDLTVGPTGNVGIGTTAPSSLLDVNGNINALQYQVGTWNAINYSGSKLQLGGVSGGQFSSLGLFTNGSERITIDMAGNVGIGTTPEANLHIKRTTSDRNTLTRTLIAENYSNNNPYAGFGTGLLFKLSTYNPVESINAGAIDAVMETYDSGPVFSSGLKFSVVPSYATGLIEAMRITAGGSTLFGNPADTRVQIANGGYIEIVSPSTNDNLVIRPKGSSGSVMFNYGTGGTVRFYNSGTNEVASIDTAGFIRASGDVIAYAS